MIENNKDEVYDKISIVISQIILLHFATNLIRLSNNGLLFTLKRLFL